MPTLAELPPEMRTRFDAAPPLGRTLLKKMYASEWELRQRFGTEYTILDCAKSPKLMAKYAVWLAAFICVGPSEEALYTFFEVIEKLRS